MMWNGGNKANNNHHALKSISCKRRALTLNIGKKQKINQIESGATPVKLKIVSGEIKISVNTIPSAIIKTKKVKLQNSRLFARPEKQKYNLKHFFTYPINYPQVI